MRSKGIFIGSGKRPNIWKMNGQLLNDNYTNVYAGESVIVNNVIYIVDFVSVINECINLVVDPFYIDINIDININSYDDVINLRNKLGKYPVCMISKYIKNNDDIEFEEMGINMSDGLLYKNERII